MVHVKLEVAGYILISWVGALLLVRVYIVRELRLGDTSCATIAIIQVADISTRRG